MRRVLHLSVLAALFVATACSDGDKSGDDGGSRSIAQSSAALRSLRATVETPNRRVKLCACMTNCLSMLLRPASASA